MRERSPCTSGGPWRRRHRRDIRARANSRIRCAGVAISVCLCARQDVAHPRDRSELGARRRAVGDISRWCCQCQRRGPLSLRIRARVKLYHRSRPWNGSAPAPLGLRRVRQTQGVAAPLRRASVVPRFASLHVLLEPDDAGDAAEPLVDVGLLPLVELALGVPDAEVDEGPPEGGLLAACPPFDVDMSDSEARLDTGGPGKV